MTPKTGGLAGFGTADGWAASRWQEFAAAGSLLDAKGVAHPMSVEVRDTQSDINFAGTVAADLITNAKVDILMAASTTDTTIPAALQAEALGCPCVLTTARPILSFEASAERTILIQVVVLLLLEQPGLGRPEPRHLHGPAVATNNIAGCLWANDVEGNDRRSFYPSQMEAKGIKVVDGGPFAHGLEDWSNIVNQFKAAAARSCRVS